MVPVGAQGWLPLSGDSTGTQLALSVMDYLLLFWPLYMAAWAALQHSGWILKGTFQKRGYQEEESRNLQAKQGLVSEQTQHHFHHIQLVKIATDSAQSQMTIQGVVHWESSKNTYHIYFVDSLLLPK